MHNSHSIDNLGTQKYMLQKTEGPHLVYSDLTLTIIVISAEFQLTQWQEMMGNDDTESTSWCLKEEVSCEICILSPL